MKAHTRIWVVIVFLIINCLAMFSQDTLAKNDNEQILVFKNKLTGKEFVIKEKTKLLAKNNEGKSFHGRLKIINDSVIIIGKDTSLLAAITIFKSKNASSELTAVLLIVSGILIMVPSLFGSVSPHPVSNGSGGFIVLGFLFTSIGTILESIWIPYKKDTYEFYIRKSV